MIIRANMASMTAEHGPAQLAQHMHDSCHHERVTLPISKVRGATSVINFGAGLFKHPQDAIHPPVAMLPNMRGSMSLPNIPKPVGFPHCGQISDRGKGLNQISSPPQKLWRQELAKEGAARAGLSPCKASSPSSAAEKKGAFFAPTGVSHDLVQHGDQALRHCGGFSMRIKPSGSVATSTKQHASALPRGTCAARDEAAPEEEALVDENRLTVPEVRKGAETGDPLTSKNSTIRRRSVMMGSTSSMSQVSTKGISISDVRSVVMNRKLSGSSGEGEESNAWQRILISEAFQVHLRHRAKVLGRFADLVHSLTVTIDARVQLLAGVPLFVNVSSSGLRVLAAEMNTRLISR